MFIITTIKESSHFVEMTVEQWLEQAQLLALGTDVCSCSSITFVKWRHTQYDTGTVTKEAYLGHEQKSSNSRTKCTGLSP